MRQTIFAFLGVLITVVSYAMPIKITERNVHNLPLSDVYYVLCEVNLNGKTIILPHNCTLIFKRRGCFSNGSIEGSDVRVVSAKKRVRFKRNVSLLGQNWESSQAYSEWFDAVPDCEIDKQGNYLSGTDNSQAFNNCFKFNRIQIKKGTYYVRGHLVTNRSDQIIKGNNATIKGSFTNRYQGIITIGNHPKSGASCNVTIKDLFLIGSKDETEDSTQWAHGLVVQYSKGVFVSNVHSSKCQGDGFNVAECFYEDNLFIPQNIEIVHCSSDNNYRCGLSVTGGRNITISNSSFNNTQGHEPQCGIDIEPNYYTQKNNTTITSICCSIEINTCSFKNNTHLGINVESPRVSENLGTFPVSDIRIINCYFWQNGISIWRVNNMNVFGCKLESAIPMNGIVFQNAEQRDISIYDTTIRNTSKGNPDAIGIFVCPGHNRANLKFENLVIEGTYKYCFFIPSDEGRKGSISNASFRNISASNGWHNFFVGNLVEHGDYNNITSNNLGKSIEGNRYEGWTWGWDVYK